MPPERKARQLLDAVGPDQAYEITLEALDRSEPETVFRHYWTDVLDHLDNLNGS